MNNISIAPFIAIMISILIVTLGAILGIIFLIGLLF